jgi:hypothetical protein
MAKAVLPLGQHPPEDPLRWHDSTTPGYTQWQYKDGPSSDDVTGYYFALPLYIEYVAQTDTERAMAIEMLRSTTDYIMKNDYYLINVDGRPTRWGIWNPSDLNNNTRYYSERASNSLEILTFLAVTHHYVRDQKYLDAMYKLGFDD